MSMVEIVNSIGWGGSFLLAICGLPLAIDSIRKGRTDGISAWFLWMWLIGELCLLLYTLFKFGTDKALIFNYSVNIMFIIITLRYYYFPRSLE